MLFLFEFSIVEQSRMRFSFVGWGVGGGVGWGGGSLLHVLSCFILYQLVDLYLVEHICNIIITNREHMIKEPFSKFIDKKLFLILSNIFCHIAQQFAQIADRYISTLLCLVILLSGR